MSLESFKKPQKKTRINKKTHPQRKYTVIFKETDRLALVRRIDIDTVSSLHAVKLTQRNYGKKIEILNVELRNDE